MIMTGKALYEDVEKKVKISKVKEAITLALSHVLDNDIKVELVSFSEKIYRIERDERLNIKDPNNIELRRSQITASLLRLLSDYGNIEISVKPLKLYRIGLISSVVTKDNQTMEAFFSNVDLEIENIIVEEKDFVAYGKFDLIIYDNRFWNQSRYRKEKQDREKLMEKVIKEKSNSSDSSIELPFFLHLGPNWDKMNAYAEHFQGANSLFSLYHRILEILEFIRLYRFEK